MHSVALRSFSRRNFLITSAAGLTSMSATARTALGHSSKHTHDFELASLDGTHDLPFLSAWGPYSKKLYGISHIPDLDAGLLFDLSIFPTLEGAPVQLPNVTDRCGVHPWQAAPDLTFYATRTELLWKDQVYCDHAYIHAGSNNRLIRIELVNNTALPQRIRLHALSQLCFPPLHELTAQPIRVCEVSLPPSAIWVDALNYEEMRFAVPRPTDNLVPEGRWRGEERMHDAVGGSVLAQGFGRDAGDTALYKVTVHKPIEEAAIVLRFHAEAGRDATLHCTGLTSQDVILHGTGDFATATVFAGALAAGEHTLRLTCRGGTPVALNGFAVLDRRQASALDFPARPWRPQPQIASGPNHSLLLRYPDIDAWYGFTLGPPAATPQLLAWKDVDRTFGARSGQDTQDRIFGRGRGRPGDPDSLFVQTSWPVIELSPSSRHTIVGLVTSGTEQQVRSGLQAFDPSPGVHEERYRQAATRAVALRSNPHGQPYLLSQQLLAATTLTNVVYPLRAQRQTIRDYSPGKIWDCLYTWDAGFIGLGLLELDLHAAIESLHAYLTPPGSQSAFIHHGTPLPTQIYLAAEIWNRTQSAALLRRFYPSLRQYYLFLAGRLGSSTTRPHRNGLICTWDYFYNSGGWDDYPPQVYMHKNKLEAHTAPTVSTSHVIRCAKLLRLFARELGARNDIPGYEADIHLLSAALQRDAWDEASGYFGYVTYNSAGEPDGILRTPAGLNYNLGLDGLSPLIAGICLPEQQKISLTHLFSEDHLWTPVGITTVDKQASYYNPDGYWNGSVWFAHQWFLFKTMLDLGRGDLAMKIAQTGVETWRRSTDESYDCMEHFRSHPPYGAGWSQFSSLSSPALSWFAALYTPGRVTVGFDTWIRELTYDEKPNDLGLRLSFTRGADESIGDVLICLRPATHYNLHCNGRGKAYTELLPGLLRVSLSRTDTSPHMKEARITMTSAAPSLRWMRR
jgi:hypothetical protein